jgi:hypothetical protein
MVRLIRKELLPDDPIFSEGPTVYTPVLVQRRRAPQSEIGLNNAEAGRKNSELDASSPKSLGPVPDSDHGEI